MNLFSGVAFDKYHMVHYQMPCLRYSLNYNFYRFDLSFLVEEI